MQVRWNYSKPDVWSPKFGWKWSILLGPRPGLKSGTSWDKYPCMFHLFLNRFLSFSDAIVSHYHSINMKSSFPKPETSLPSRGHGWWDPFWRSESNKQCKSMVILRNFPYNTALFGWTRYMMTIWPLQHWTPPKQKNEQHWTPPKHKKNENYQNRWRFRQSFHRQNFLAGQQPVIADAVVQGLEANLRQIPRHQLEHGRNYNCLGGSPEKNDAVDFINEKVPCSFLLSSSMCNFMMKVWQNDSEESFWLKDFLVHCPSSLSFAPTCCTVQPYRKWCGPRLSRIRNPDLKPFVAAEVSASDRRFVEL